PTLFRSKTGVFHLEGAGNACVRDKLMDGSIGAENYLTVVEGLEGIRAMGFVFHFYYFGAHPLFKEFGILVSFKKQGYRQVKIPRNKDIMLTFFSLNLGFYFHFVADVGYDSLSSVYA